MFASHNLRFLNQLSIFTFKSTCRSLKSGYCWWADITHKKKICFLACFLWNCLTLFWIFSRSGQSLIWIPSLNKTFFLLELQSLSLWWINFLSLWKGRNLLPNLHILLKLILAKNVFYSAMILLVCCGVRTFRNTHRILNRFPAISKIDSATEFMLSTPGRK